MQRGLLFQRKTLGKYCLNMESVHTSRIPSESSDFSHPVTAIGEFLLQRLKIHARSSRKGEACQIDPSDGKSLSFEEMLSASVRAARGWRARGVKMGDTVAVFAVENFTSAFLGAIFEGVTLALFDHQWKKEELIRALSESKPSVVVTDFQRVDFISAALLDTETVSAVILNAGKETSEGVKALQSFLDVGEDIDFETASYCSREIPDVHLHTAFLMFTSGSTGFPKALTISNHSYFTRCLAPHTWEVNLGCNPAVIHRMNTTKVQSWGVDVMHKLVCIASGVTQVLGNHLDPAQTVRIIEQYKVTTWFTTPHLLLKFASFVRDLSPRPDLSSVQFVRCSGAPLLAANQQDVIEALGFPVYQEYGSTETSTISTDCRPPNPPVLGSVGLPVSWMEVKIMNATRDAEITEYGEVGEICVKSASVTESYVFEPEKQQQAFDEHCFYRTGDLAYKDQTGHIFIVDRLKNMLYYNAFEVSPTEIESVLVKHEGVSLACVGGRPHVSLGDVPSAFVVRSPGSTVTEKELQDYVSGCLSDQKHLRGGIYFIQEPLLTPRGKLNRSEINKKLKSMPFAAGEDFEWSI